MRRQDRRYSIGNIRRAFLKARIAERRSFEMQARQRWVAYYRQFVEILSRQKIEESYWKYLGGGKVHTLQYDWPNLLNVLEWVDQHQRGDDLIDLMMPLVHYLDRRAYHQVRIAYASKAAQAARELRKIVAEALFRIDALGVTLRKIGRHDEAINQIEMGLALVDSLDSSNKEVNNLKALGYIFQARSYIEKIH